VKITEADLAPRRPNGWRPVLLVPSELSPRANDLPLDLFGDSGDLFPHELSGCSGGVVALLAFTRCVPPLSPNYEWFCISHQSGGHACNHPNFVGTPLRLRPDIQTGLRNLAARYHDAGGHFHRGNVPASGIFAYVHELGDIGLHCETSYSLLEEGVYPVDATEQHLNILSECPPLLDALSDAFRSADGLVVIVLSENSD
jgi:hypothetical protein